MRFLILSVLLLTGCTIQSQDLDAREEVNKLAVVQQAIVNYIAALQEKGVLPKPEQEKPDASK